MATFTAIKNRGGGRGALGGVLRYVQQKDKTTWEEQRLVSGWNCTALSACTEMQLTKERFYKTDGRQYYHFVQSFGVQDNLSPQEVHAMGLELARREFPDFEVLVATHMDTEHLHNHLVVNSVSYQDGRKLHQSAADLQAHRVANDEICIAHHLEVLPPPPKQVRQQRMSSREYRAAAKGKSWKFRLINTIDQCMRYASTKEEFLSLMESEGYQVRWSNSRKNITYTTPLGMKCRDERLHDEKYTKEVMEHEFRIRAAIIHGGIETAQRATTDAATDLPYSGGMAGAAPTAGQPEAAHGSPHSHAAGGFPAAGTVSHPGTDGGTGTGGGGDPRHAATGWEAERAAALSMPHEAAQTVVAPFGGANLVCPGDDVGGVAAALVGMGRRLEQLQSPAPVNGIHHTADRKTLRREQQKKIALGHKADDHEDEPNWQQIMQ